MTPEQIAKSGTESAHQQAFMCWCVQHPDPRLNFAFAIPNGGLRNKREAARLVAEGVRKGVPDVFLPITNPKYAGLWIEFKAPGDNGKAKGKLSVDQIKWSEYLVSQNYFHFVAFGYLPAIEVTLNYLSSN